MGDRGDRLRHAADKAAYAGDLPELIRLQNEGYRFEDPWHCTCAAGGGHLEVLRWLRENGCPWNDRAIKYAAEKGHLAVLRWLVDNGCPWSNYACSAAAENGHLDVLQWMRGEQEACPWNGDACASAAKHGHLDVLVWIYENGGAYKCPDDGVHDDCQEFWTTYAVPHWSRGEYVPVSPAPKPAKK